MGWQQVVHSMKTEEADCVEAITHFGDIEWTTISNDRLTPYTFQSRGDNSDLNPTSTVTG